MSDILGGTGRAVVLRLLFWMLSVIILQHQSAKLIAAAGDGFIRTNATHFIANGKPFYLNGFNSYWLMYEASYPWLAGNVTSAFQQASQYEMTVARTWAFSDGGSRPLQIKPGIYNEEMFKGLDFVVSEAKKLGVYLILSLVNNYPELGGRKQYVAWAKEQGEPVSSEDDFYTNAVVRGYYKNNAKTVLTRVNTFTGVAYKDDPTIFAWELINEPRCESDLSGNMFQAWVKEMASYVKSVDSNHMLEIGLEGFYGNSNRQLNPNGYLFGTDFIANNQIPEVDFTTIHAYADQWLQNSTDDAQLQFLKDWSNNHIQFSQTLLNKPLLLCEFGKSSKDSGYTTNKRDDVFNALYDSVLNSARTGGPLHGALFWQLLDQGMDNFRDGYEIILSESPSTAQIIAQQSKKLLPPKRTAV